LSASPDAPPRRDVPGDGITPRIRLLRAPDKDMIIKPTVGRVISEPKSVKIAV